MTAPRRVQHSNAASPRRAARRGAIVVYPQSRPGAWPLVLDWARPDFAFFDALIDELDKRYGIDRARVFITSMSNGAYFANLLASQRSTVIASIATHSGGLGALGLANVAIARKYPVMIIHGAADQIIDNHLLDGGRRIPIAHRAFSVMDPFGG